MALLQSLNIAWIRFEVVGHVIAILASEASEGPVKHKNLLSVEETTHRHGKCCPYFER